MTENKHAISSAAHSRPRRRRNAKPRQWPWVVAIIAAIALVIPLGTFAYAYAQYTVPQPDELANKQISVVLANDGNTELARIVPPEGNRSHVTLEQIPDSVENAVLAAEDREFWTNSGFSFTGFARAALGQITGNDTAGGGSTITQQYVKNTLVGNDISYVRKARELVYSIKMTNEWSKEEILNAYLNTVYFGRNAYGVQAASNAYFNKDVEQLTAEEGALLAGVIQAPSAWDPAINPEQAEQRWNYVLDGMVETGALDQAQRQDMTMPATRNPSEYSAYTEASGANAHIKNRVVDELGTLGISEEDITTRGLRITTTIDMTVQNASVDAVDANLAPLQEDARAAAVTIEPATGAIRGYFGGAETEGWDYANAPTQTGSTFKIITLAAALEQGIPLSAVYSSAPYQAGDALVENDGGMGCGACTVSEALKNSFNTSFMRLQADLENTTQDTADMAYALGVAKSLPGEPRTLTENGGQPYEGIVLGQYPSRPLDMATVMSTLANEGVWHAPHFVQRVETNTGEVLYEHPADKGERRVSAQVANNVIEAMKPIAGWSNATLAGGRESAAKTGTVQLGDTGLNKDTWLVGATPQLATAVWVGTADNASAIYNAWGGVMYGAGAAAQIWKQIQDTSLADAPWESFPVANPVRYGSGGGANSGGWAVTDYYGGYNTWSDPGTAAEEAPADAPSPEAPAPAPAPAPEPAAPAAPGIDEFIGDLQNIFG